MQNNPTQPEEPIKIKHSFGWTPKYQTEIPILLRKEAAIALVLEVFKELEWDVVFHDVATVEAKRRGDFNSWTEKITVTYQTSSLLIQSVSLDNSFWDVGRNSRRVREFLLTFRKVLRERDPQSIAELESAFKEENEMVSYQVPTSLPLPQQRKNTGFFLPLLGGIASALAIGYCIAFLSSKGFYIIGLFETGVGFLIAFILTRLVRLSNYTTYSHLHSLLIGMVILIYTSNQYFQYLFILHINPHTAMTFPDFLGMRIAAGLTVQSVDTGTTGLIISWILQLGLTYLIATFRFALGFSIYQTERVPPEVTEFAVYHFVQGKSETQVRSELSKMGWGNTNDQDNVMEAIGAGNTLTTANRME